MDNTHPAPILIGVDGSDGSRAGLAAAVELGAPTATPLLAVFVRPHSSSLMLSAIAASEYQRAQEALAAEIEADLLLTLVDYPGEWRFTTTEGDPTNGLIDAATESTAKLVVVGHKGHSAIAGVLLGSVALRLVYHCPVNVLIAR